MGNILEVKDLEKSFRNKKVIEQSNFSIKEGEFLALLGPNGAGKSTTIAIICGLLSFENGEINICGHVLSKENNTIRKQIGIVFQNSVLDDILTLKSNLLLRCGFYNLTKKQAMHRVNELIVLCRLEKFVNQKVSTLSGGERRRGDIARALIAEPRLLILDEPTTGLDPQSRVQIWETIESLQKKSSMAILLTTHYLEEAEKANQIMMMNHGKIIAKGSVQELPKKFSVSTLILYSRYLPMLEKVLRNNYISFISNNERVEIRIHSNSNPLSILNKVEIYVDRFEVRTGTIEDAFLEIMKEK
ncbi:MAG: ABC transporter ATP-binding protein [Coprobacillaceae bacterium]